MNRKVEPMVSAPAAAEGEVDIQRLVRRVDLRVIPILFILFLLSFLDRSNIGHAKLFNLESDLNLTPGQYAMSLSIFFIGYILFEIPSNLMLKRTKPNLWFAIIMVGWGLAMVGMTFVTDHTSLWIMRFVLGSFEAGLFPGIIYYLKFWYTREEQGTRIAYIICALLLSGGVGGLISYSMGLIAGKFNLTGWQWIFLIEGSITVVVGLSAWWLLPDQPESVTWLNEVERAEFIDRLRADFVESKLTKFNLAEVAAGLSDYKTYLISIIYFGFSCSMYSISLTIPTLIKSMGFDNMSSILLTIPPYIAAMPCALLVARNSDRTLQRAYHLIFLLGLGIIGYLLQIVCETFIVKYFGLFLSVCGSIPCVPILLAWNNNNTRGATKSATTSAMAIMACNLSGVLAGQLYWPNDGPEFKISNAVNLCLLVLSMLCSFILRCLLSRENYWLDRESLQHQLTDGGLPAAGEKSPGKLEGFRYIL